jgi:uncharacterized protein YcbX
MITISSLHIYPVKSCRGIEREQARLTEAGLEYDREWMVVSPEGRFLTQREEPRLARIGTWLAGAELRLSVDGHGAVGIPLEPAGATVEVSVWGERCAALEQRAEVSDWLSGFLGRRVRLVRFDPRSRRCSDSNWTGDADAYSRFADGFALLAISLASLADLNARLERPLPMNRFRPNLVLAGLEPYAEDELGDFGSDRVRLRGVKPCTRCRITTTDQLSGEVQGEEPLRTLKTYRWDPRLRGVKFGQNVIVLDGAGVELRKGQTLARLPVDSQPVM